jgi:hypothetical protein
MKNLLLGDGGAEDLFSGCGGGVLSVRGLQGKGGWAGNVVETVGAVGTDTCGEMDRGVGLAGVVQSGEFDGTVLTG